MRKELVVLGAFALLLGAGIYVEKFGLPTGDAPATPAAAPSAKPVREPAPLADAGHIYVDSPEVYTRERLVNDRYEQDAWLRRRLSGTDDLEFGVQGIRHIRDTTKALAEAAFRLQLPSYKGASADSPADAPDNSQAGQNTPPAADGSAAVPKSTPDRSPTDDFRDRVAYREEIRNAIIENQLDDRHDLDGNTLYRLKFDATVVPVANNTHWGKIEVTLSPQLTHIKVEGYSKEWSMADRAQYLQRNWVNKSDETYENAERWNRVFRTYLDGLSQNLTSQISTRVAAVRAVLDSGEYLGSLSAEADRDFKELVRRIEDVSKEAIQRETRLPREASENEAKRVLERCENRSGYLKLAKAAAIKPDTTSIGYASCMVYDTADVITTRLRSSNESHHSSGLIVDWIIAQVLLKHYLQSGDGRGRGSREQWGRERARIEFLRIPSFQVVVHAEPDTRWDGLFDPYDYDELGFAAPLTPRREDNYASVESICRDENPELFEWIDERIASYGIDPTDPFEKGPLIYQLHAYRMSADPDTGLLQCFDSSGLDISRKDGFITFLEAFMNGESQPSFSYAITPKESVQRLSEESDKSSALSALSAIGLAAGAVNVDATASALKQMQESYTGLSRHPLVVGYTHPQALGSAGGTGSHAISFGWIISPRLRVGEDGSTPEYRQVLSQQSLSALISVPAWWHAVDLEVKTSWIGADGSAKQIGDPIKYTNVRLPGDLHEIRRTLNPQTDKAPKIDRLRMGETVLRVEYPKTAPEESDGKVGSASRQWQDEDRDAVRLVIPGRNLWRSTVVTLGAERARQIWVMPNMGGIVASFERFPHIAGDRPRHVPLRVWTSEGVDVVHQMVCVVPATAASLPEEPCGTAPADTFADMPPPPQQVASAMPIEPAPTPASTAPAAPEPPAEPAVAAAIRADTAPLPAATPPSPVVRPAPVVQPAPVTQPTQAVPQQQQQQVQQQQPQQQVQQQLPQQQQQQQVQQAQLDQLTQAIQQTTLAPAQITALQPPETAADTKDTRALAQQVDALARLWTEAIAPLRRSDRSATESEIEEALALTTQLKEAVKALSKLSAEFVISVVANGAAEAEEALKVYLVDPSAVERMESSIAVLALHLEVLDGVNRRQVRESITEQLASITNQMALVPSGGRAATLIKQQDDSLQIRLQSAQFSALRDLDVEMHVGISKVVPTADLDSDAASETEILIKSRVPDDAFDTDPTTIVMDIPLSPKPDAATLLKNGDIVQLHLLITDGQSGASVSVAANRRLVYYETDKASAIAFSSDTLRLDRDTLDALFTMTVPARLAAAYPRIGRSDVDVTAVLNNVQTSVDVYPVADIDEEDLMLPYESNYTMVLSFDSEDRAALERHFNEGSTELVIKFEQTGADPAELPKMPKEMRVAGFVEPTAKK